MAKQQKFITSHACRVKRAKQACKNSPEKISIFDREAFVEFYLLEDIVRLYEYRVEKERAKNVTTRGGEMARQRNIEKFSAIINVFKSAIEIAWAEISAGDYKAVRKAIHEHALMVAANSIKYLPELREMAVDLLRTLSDEALEAAKESAAIDDELDAIEDHERNTRLIKGLPSESEIAELIRAVEVAIPSETTAKAKARPKTY